MSARILGLDDVDGTVLEDFLTLRKAKKSPLTVTAVKGLRAEAAKAGMSLESVLALCCERGWVGFRAGWMDQTVNSAGVLAARPAPRAESFRERDDRLAREQWERMTGRAHPDSLPGFIVIDAEPKMNPRISK